MKALLLAALLLAPVALADHVYSHRYVLEGRLLGSDDLPLPGRGVDFFAEGDDFLQPCREGPHDSVTDAEGDFRFCFHHHEIASGSRIGVRSGNASEMRPVDLGFRKTYLTLHEPNETGVEPSGWSESYRISGRVWRVGAQELEGILVYGEAVIGAQVNLTVRDDQGGASVFTTRTDDFGDYDLLVETAADPSLLDLTLEVLGRAQPTQLDLRTHRTYAPIHLAPDANAPSPTRITPEQEERPGAKTPRLDPVLVVAVALALVVAVVLSRRNTR